MRAGTAYYNEHDKFAAAWLRELIAMLDQVRRASNSCDQADGGTWGKEPTSYPASEGSLLSAEPLAVRGLACGQSPSLLLRRTPRKSAELPGSTSRSGGFGSQAATSSSFALDKSLPSAGGARGMCGHSVRSLPDGKHQSKAICYVGAGRSRTAIRTGGNRGVSPDHRGRSSSTSALCIVASRNACVSGRRASWLRTRRIWATFPCSQTTTSYGALQ
jgi:hypothetical protein